MKALVLSLAAMLAPAVLAVWLAIVAFGGATSPWAVQDETLPEAVAINDLGEVVRLLALGADPNVPDRVRPGLLGGDPGTATPIEAALVRADRYMLETLRRRGAVLDPAAVAAFRCRQDLLNNPNTRALLADLSEEAWPVCGNE